MRSSPSLPTPCSWNDPFRLKRLLEFSRETEAKGLTFVMDAQLLSMHTSPSCDVEHTREQIGPRESDMDHLGRAAPA